MTFKTAIFITARLKSKRLPKKVIKPILGQPMIEHMIERLKRTGISPIVMMTSTNFQDDPLIEIAKRNNIDYFRGSEDDVLARIRDCARKFKPDLIISATADDPLKEPILIQRMIERYKETGFDFCEIEGVPDGCESYALSKKAVEKVCELKDDEDTEIWGPYFRDTGVFKCEKIKIDDPKIFRPHYRVTVDTPEDFEVVLKVFENLSKQKDYFDIYDICGFLDQNPKIVKINSHIETRKPPQINIKSTKK